MFCLFHCISQSSITSTSIIVFHSSSTSICILHLSSLSLLLILLLIVGSQERLQQAGSWTVHRFVWTFNVSISILDVFTTDFWNRPIPISEWCAGILRTNGMKLEEGGLSSSPGVVLYPAYCLINHACRWPTSHKHKHIYIKKQKHKLSCVTQIQM